MINPIYNPGLNKMDIIQQYIDIAFADITDYIEFGVEDIATKEGSVIKRNFARLKVDMIEAHPGPIKEIIANGDNIKIKLHNRMEALDKLSRYIGQLRYESAKAAIIRDEIYNSDIEVLEGGWIRVEDFNKFIRSNEL
ncbi:MAG: terminase small subunit [Peptostreptococcaceae bacterium]